MTSGFSRVGVTHFYPRPPRGGRPRYRVAVSDCNNISIHALREEGDGRYPGRWDERKNFYPRPPRGGRHNETGKVEPYNIFLSTPSARRATSAKQFKSAKSWISIHALREEGDICAWQSPCSTYLFLSTPSARRATAEGSCLISLWEFLSTPSARRATRCLFTASRASRISIHALREEGDVIP